MAQNAWVCKECGVVPLSQVDYEERCLICSGRVVWDRIDTIDKEEELIKMVKEMCELIDFDSEGQLTTDRCYLEVCKQKLLTLIGI